LNTHILVVDDEPDVESMFRQHFRRDLRSGRFVLEFALSAVAALERVKTIAAPSLILILSDINMPGMTCDRASSTDRARAAEMISSAAASSRRSSSGSLCRMYERENIQSSRARGR